ncbi:MAG: hypothetical protein REJ23_10400 [Brevundimonas sp.]|nr:hypothetical protein [Brevundimonas sp.]
MLHIFAAVLALSDPAGPVVEVRIADVIADPERYGGQALRIRGQVDACYGFVCSICPEEMTPDTADGEKCLRIAFDGFVSEEDRAREDEGGYMPAPWHEVEKLFRFSVVTAEGVFNPSCLTNRPWPREPGARADDVVVCSDRATTWQSVRVRAVHRRLPSNAGLVFDRERGGLSPAPESVSVPVKTAYRDYLRLIGSDEDDPSAVFIPELANLKPGLASEEARLCICLKDDCEADWPRRDVSVWARTSNDPYICHVALRTDGVWRVFPE